MEADIIGIGWHRFVKNLNERLIPYIENFVVYCFLNKSWWSRL